MTDKIDALRKALEGLKMTDRELVKLCAERMGLTIYAVSANAFVVNDDNEDEREYNPLTDDAQCMAMVKRFGIEIRTHYKNPDGVARKPDAWSAHLPDISATNPDLNRAVCLAVARMK